MGEYVHCAGPILRQEDLELGHTIQDGRAINLGIHKVNTRGFLDEHLVNYKGNVVIVCEYRATTDSLFTPCSVVSGRLVSTDGRVSQVEPITDGTERQELTDLIQAMGIKGPINFWK